MSICHVVVDTVVDTVVDVVVDVGVDAVLTLYVVQMNCVTCTVFSV